MNGCHFEMLWCSCNIKITKGLLWQTLEKFFLNLKVRTGVSQHWPNSEFIYFHASTDAFMRSYLYSTKISWSLTWATVFYTVFVKNVRILNACFTSYDGMFVFEWIKFKLYLSHTQPYIVQWLFAHRMKLNIGITLK